MAQLIPIGLFLATLLAFTSAKSIHREQGYRIMWGELANITELPHHVHFRWNGTFDTSCNGAIISPQHILIAAVCAYDRMEEYKVVAATNDREMSGEEYPIAEITKYDDDSLAVVKLAKKIKISDKAKPIALAGPKFRIEDGAELIASGWNFYARENHVYISDKLRKVTISKVSDDECKESFASIDLSQAFCAGGEVGKRSCLWDVGSPLIARTTKGNVLVGLTSYSGGCDGRYKYVNGLFTKVSQFHKWIKEIVKQDMQSSE